MAVPSLASAADTIRLFLHVLSASVWVGGQIVMAAVVPEARASGGRELTRKLANRFSMVARPAFVVLLLTGIWSVFTFNLKRASTGWLVALSVLIASALASGITAELHAAAKSPKAVGALASASALFGLLAMALGILVAG